MCKYLSNSPTRCKHEILAPVKDASWFVNSSLSKPFGDENSTSSGSPASCCYAVPCAPSLCFYPDLSLPNATARAISFVQVPKCWPESLCIRGKLFIVPDNMLKIKVIELSTPYKDKFLQLKKTVLNCEMPPLFLTLKFHSNIWY